LNVESRGAEARDLSPRGPRNSGRGEAMVDTTFPESIWSGIGKRWSLTPRETAVLKHLVEA